MFTCVLIFTHILIFALLFSVWNFWLVLYYLFSRIIYWDCDFSCFIWSIIWLDIVGFFLRVFLFSFLQYLKYITVLCSGLHGVWWEVSCYFIEDSLYIMIHCFSTFRVPLWLDFSLLVWQRFLKLNFILYGIHWNSSILNVPHQILYSWGQ